MMAITTMLAFVYARHAWGWSPLRATVVFGCFLALDLTFLSANYSKVDGGWFPILAAAAVLAVMSTWWRGRKLLDEIRALL